MGPLERLLSLSPFPCISIGMHFLPFSIQPMGRSFETKLFSIDLALGGCSSSAYTPQTFHAYSLNPFLEVLTFVEKCVRKALFLNRDSAPGVSNKKCSGGVSMECAIHAGPPTCIGLKHVLKDLAHGISTLLFDTHN